MWQRPLSLRYPGFKFLEILGLNGDHLGLRDQQGRPGGGAIGTTRPPLPSYTPHWSSGKGRRVGTLRLPGLSQLLWMYSLTVSGPFRHALPKNERC